MTAVRSRADRSKAMDHDAGQRRHRRAREEGRARSGRARSGRARPEHDAARRSTRGRRRCPLSGVRAGGAEAPPARTPRLACRPDGKRSSRLAARASSVRRGEAASGRLAQAQIGDPGRVEDLLTPSTGLEKSIAAGKNLRQLFFETTGRRVLRCGKAGVALRGIVAFDVDADEVTLRRRVERDQLLGHVEPAT